jgi:ribonuclease-3 family protein
MKNKPFSTHDASQLSPLTLAYIGDAVYELLVRDHIVRNGNASSDSLHKKSVEFVSASSQANAYHAIEGFLTEAELDFCRRGRNSSSVHAPKNTPMSSYRTATGLEALFGYLSLTGQDERMYELFELILEYKKGVI